MQVHQAIQKRRAYRALQPVKITDDLIEELINSVQLSPSCYNNQPWRFVFSDDEDILDELLDALSEGNQNWAKHASLMVTVFSHPALDCNVKGRQYAFFDTGLATSFLLLRATEMNLVAHPIAGYDEDRIKQILDIPDHMQVITLVIIGKHDLESPKAEKEKNRPERLPHEKFAFRNRYTGDEVFES